ncbi:MAG: ATP-dependent Clp protease adaptor ClpS [Prevotellaceae bacterium]|nr:ATP-dependent Clp protease adaptor ClpS [Candidatus Minthosoma caballi]
MAKNQSAIKEQSRIMIGEPQKYKVIMHNDDFTTMEFVVEVLRTVFYKSTEDAEALMLKVHKEGKAVVGIYSLDSALTKIRKVMQMAHAQGFPFKMTYEPEDTELPF